MDSSTIKLKIYEYGKETKTESVSMMCEKNGDMWDCWDVKNGIKTRATTKLRGAMDLILKGVNPANVID